MFLSRYFNIIEDIKMILFLLYLIVTIDKNIMFYSHTTFYSWHPLSKCITHLILKEINLLFTHHYYSKITPNYFNKIISSYFIFLHTHHFILVFYLRYYHFFITLISFEVLGMKTFLIYKENLLLHSFQKNKRHKYKHNNIIIVTCFLRKNIFVTSIEVLIKTNKIEKVKF